MLSVLSYIVVVLTIIIGLAILTSNRHTKGRFSAISLAMTYFGAAFWALFVQLFLTSTNESNMFIFQQIFAVVALMIPISCIFYTFSLYKRKMLSILICSLAFIGVAVVGYSILTNPGMLCTNFFVAEGYNYTVLNNNLLGITYSGIFGVYLTASVIMIFLKSLNTKNNASVRRGLFFVGCGLLLSVGICLISNIIMPILGYHEWFWVGPLSIAITMLFTYFAALKYKLFVNDSSLLQSATYLVVVTIAAILYICLFYSVFMLLFRGANPSDEIIIFNFIMVVIVILLLPSINHLITRIKEMISANVSSEEQSEKK